MIYNVGYYKLFLEKLKLMLFIIIITWPAAIQDKYLFSLIQQCKLRHHIIKIIGNQYFF